MSQKKFEPFRQIGELPSRLYVIFAILTIAAHVVLCILIDEVNPAVWGLILIAVYFAISVAIYFITKRRFSLFEEETNAGDEQKDGLVYAFRNYVRTPYAVVTESGKIITVNHAMRNATGIFERVFNTDISSLCGLGMNEILFQTSEEEAAEAEEREDGEYDIQKEELAKKECIVSVNRRLYHIYCHKINSGKKPYYLLVFDDVNELKELQALHYRELTAVGYIILDNLEEIAQYVKVDYEAETIQADKIIREWASGLNAVIRAYDRSKYIILLNREQLEECVKNKFDILAKISDVRIGEENMPITASMGIATTGDNLSARERDALVALDLAIQRGGGQVVLKTSEGNEYFGGRTKSQQKRTGKQSRIIANQLCSLMGNASNVVVMGHSNPDFDSIGACIGIAALAMHLDADVKIVMDMDSENFKSSTARLRQFSNYKNIFIDGVAGLSECTFNTLLIIVDANNFKILEAPEIAQRSFRTVVIDHHIKKEEFAEAPILQYIDPTASSASELVSEILEFSLPAGVLRKEEANILMSGLMVDTNNFTRNVGTRTFGAALYLRGAGASTEYARTFFEAPFEDYMAESRFGSEARLYRDQIAITAIESANSPSGRIAAAKAADKLLTVRNVNAAFALIRMGGTVFISARSDGSINVQLILERIGGGGHFDVAGGALADTDLQTAKNILTEAIDAYLDGGTTKNT